MGHLISLLAWFPISGYAFPPLRSREGGKNGIVSVRAMIMSIIVVLGVQIPALGGCAWLAIILVDMMIAVAPAAQARVRPRMRA
jgi:hypothetical protein